MQDTILLCYIVRLGIHLSNVIRRSIIYQLEYRLAQKSKPPPIFQKIVLKIANEIRFLRKVKV